MGLQPQSYVLRSPESRREGDIEPIAKFVTNPAGAEIVNAVGPIARSWKRRPPPAMTADTWRS